MKKICIIFGLLFVILFCFNVCQANENVEVLLNKSLKVTFNNEIQEFKNVNGIKVYPISYEGTTYLPIRSISSLFKTAIKWDGETNSVLLGKGELDVTSSNKILKFNAEPNESIEVLLNQEIKIYYNSSIQTFTDVNGKIVYPLSYNGTTYLPVRAVSNLFKLKIEWIAKDNTVSIFKNDMEEVNITSYMGNFTITDIKENLDGTYEIYAAKDRIVSFTNEQINSLEQGNEVQIENRIYYKKNKSEFENSIIGYKFETNKDITYGSYLIRNNRLYYHMEPCYTISNDYIRFNVTGDYKLYLIVSEEYANDNLSEIILKYKECTVSEYAEFLGSKIFDIEQDICDGGHWIGLDTYKYNDIIGKGLFLIKKNTHNCQFIDDSIFSSEKSILYGANGKIKNL